MTWIRSPSWDSIWILSGPLIGLAMVALPLRAIVAWFFVLNTAHLISPMAVAWGHDGFRQVARERFVRFLVVPAGILVATAFLGATVTKVFAVNPLTLGVHVTDWADYARPFVWLFPIYFVWNSYHFGAQNFGLTSLYRRGWRSRRQRAIWKWSIISATIIGMHLMMLIVLGARFIEHAPSGLVAIPKYRHIPAVGMFMLGFFAFNHSLAAIGLASHVLAKHHARPAWLFAAALIIAGAMGFWLMFCAPGFTLRVTMTAVGLRVGLGFVHFLYDRWIYRLSDPQVRATIGRDIFSPGTARSG